MEKSQPPMVEALEAFWLWLAAGKCRIKGRDGTIVPLRPNALQTKIFTAMITAALQEKPIRIIGLKSRKMGFSTFIQALFYHLTKRMRHWMSQTVAHTDDSTRDIFEITGRIYVHDPDWPEEPNKPNRREITFEHDSRFATRTAGGHYVSSGATVQALHLSELAKYPGTANAVQDQMLSMLNSVPHTPASMVVIESTANASDTSGEFETRWKQSEAGGSEYVPVFSPWFEEPTYRSKGPVEDITEYEQWLIDTFAVDHEQLAWRREKIAGDFRQDEVLFKQEYPATPDEAFQVAKGKIFPCLEREKHHWSAGVLELERAGYHLYRGIDFGGADPFVCVWLAHNPDTSKPGFTIDTEACPETWREFTSYARNDLGRPMDKNNHTVDAVRYVCQTMKLQGHLHIYREMYIPNSAHKGLALPLLANMIKERSGREIYVHTVADRSRPDSIALLNQQQVFCSGYSTPETVISGMIEDGIRLLNDLMLSTIPLLHPPAPLPYHVQLARRRERAPVIYGHANTMDALAERAADNERGRGSHPLYGDCW